MTNVEMNNLQEVERNLQIIELYLPISTDI